MTELSAQEYPPRTVPQQERDDLRRCSVGLLWGDFPWATPPRKLGKLLSWGAVARNLSQALRAVGTLVPYTPPTAGAAPEERRATLAGFLRTVDVVWADCYPGSAAALALRHELRLPCRVILYAGGTLPKGAEAMLFPWRDLLRPGDALVFTCEADRAIWRRLVRRSELDELVLPCPIDESVFRPRPAHERAAIRARYNLPATAPLLLAVGRLNIQKNLHSLLRLLAAVRRGVPEAHLCLVGEEDDIALAEFGVRNTGYVAWLRAQAADLGVADAITILAPQFGEDLARLYAAAEVAVNASVYHRENFGLSQAEAQACGVPVVCTAWGGFRDVVRHGETGYLMDAVLTKHGVRVDWAAGAEYVAVLLRDPALRARLGEAAAMWAREQFGIPAQARRLATLLLDREAGRQQHGGADEFAAPAYQPSAFARRYERHKRVCGWYATAEERMRTWYPPMFCGRDYALYERLLGPYAKQLATDVPPAAIRPAWVPYAPSGVALDPVRRLAEDLDPIWPQRRSLSSAEWAVLRRVDGATTAGDIAAAVAAEVQTADWPLVTATLWQLFVEGFILFSGKGAELGSN